MDVDVWRLSSKVTLESHECGECSITYAAPEGFWEERQRDGRTWYCPNGHPRVYRDSTEQKLRRELKAKEERLQELRRARDRYQEERDTEARSHTATKGHLTRARKRAAAALCPVEDCDRKIVDMARHLTAKHPDYQPEEA